MVDVGDKQVVEELNVSDELTILGKVDRWLRTARYDGIRLLVLLHFVNQRIKWIDAYTLAELGIFKTDFYTASTRLGKLGLVERKRLNIKSFSRIADKGRRLAERLLDLLNEGRGGQS